MVIGKLYISDETEYDVRQDLANYPWVKYYQKFKIPHDIADMVFSVAKEKKESGSLW